MRVPRAVDRDRSGLVIPRSRRAFTLAELLIALTVGGLIIGSMVTFFLTQVRSSRFAGVRIEAVQRARFAAELLRREVSLAGAGIPDAQPLVVYAGPDDFVFSADLASNTPGDRVAVYQLPEAPTEETEGADSASLTLPNGETYPQVWYGPSGTPGPAETIRFSFVSRGDGRYALTRTVNDQAEDTLLRGLDRIEGRSFFSYQVLDDDGQLRDLAGDPIWHEAPIHDAPDDSAQSVLTDSLKLVGIAFTVFVRGRRPEESVERNLSMAVALKNAGLVRNAACGQAPALGVVPVATLTGVDPLAVTVTWPPAADERSGEQDVRQYTLYRRPLTETVPKPIASLPPDPNVATYTYVDNDLQPAQTYVYLLGTTDCTPNQSSLAPSEEVAVPSV